MIIFHNEAYTVLLRTITSVINRTPQKLLHEIVLVDDYSYHSEGREGGRGEGGRRRMGLLIYTITLQSLLHVVDTYVKCHAHSLNTVEDLHKKLEDWIAPNSKIKLVRHSKREGLIRARVTGANAATGEVLTFLDSHCECNVGWAEPLLERIHINRSIVVCPVIDVISWERIEYSAIRGPPGVRGGFNWGLQFKWKKIPEYEQKRRGYDETR